MCGPKMVRLISECRTLVSTAVLAYTLGLRHALDADHISVISVFQVTDAFKTDDNLGYRLNDSKTDCIRTASCQRGNILLARPFHVRSPSFCSVVGENASSLTRKCGDWIIFSIVIITSLVVAATASAISSKFDSFSRVGGIIGTSVSAAFLIILGILNMYILFKLVQQMRRLINTISGEEQQFNIHGAGCLFHLFKKMFRLIDRYVVKRLISAKDQI